jgi:hypothetical protein
MSNVQVLMVLGVCTLAWRHTHALPGSRELHAFLLMPSARSTWKLDIGYWTLDIKKGLPNGRPFS